MLIGWNNVWLSASHFVCCPFTVPGPGTVFWGTYTQQRARTPLLAVCWIWQKSAFDYNRRLHLQFEWGIMGVWHVRGTSGLTYWAYRVVLNIEHVPIKWQLPVLYICKLSETMWEVRQSFCHPAIPWTRALSFARASLPDKTVWACVSLCVCMCVCVCVCVWMYPCTFITHTNTHTHTHTHA